MIVDGTKFKKFIYISPSEAIIPPGATRPILSACYNDGVLPELHLDDIIRLRKVHPCGSYEWKVFRLGADIGLECQGCQRRVLLPRRELAHRLKGILPKPSDEQPTS